MGMTIIEKIFARASGQPVVRPGEVVDLTVDRAVLLNTNFYPAAWRELLQVPEPDKVAIVFDHRAPASDIRSATAHKVGREFAERFGVTRIPDIGRDQGIAHTVIAEKGYALPGTVLVCDDSHTCAAGAFNCAARGVGEPDMIYTVATGRTWFRLGATIRYELVGAHSPFVTTKDVFLALAARYGQHTNHNIEFGGPGLASLSIDARRSLATMAAELSADFATFEADEVLVAHLAGITDAPFAPVAPDADAEYAERRIIDLSAIEPRIALPDAIIGNTVPLSQALGARLDQGFIGSCVNGSIEDIALAARLLAGRQIAEHFRLIVTPSSQGVYREALKAGYVETLMEAGAVVTNATCGACCCAHMDLPGPWRSLHHRQYPHLQGPDGFPHRTHLHGIGGDGCRLGDCRPYRRPAHSGDGDRAMMTGRVWAFGNDINTDLIMPGWVYDQPEAMQTAATFAAVRPGFADQVKVGDVIVAGSNFGTGSSRPAARSLRNVGIRCLLAESINDLFVRNCVNFGLLALEAPGVSALFEEGDKAEIDLDGWRVTNPRNAGSVAIRRLPERLLVLMREGGIFPVLERERLIAPMPSQG